MQPLTIATLGTGSDVFLTRAVEKALKTAKQVVLRTARHPMTRYLDEQGIAYVSLDDLYDQCDDFDALNQAAAHKVLALCERQPVCYAVSDAAYDATVAALRQMLPGDAPLTVLPGVSHAQRCLALVRGDMPDFARYGELVLKEAGAISFGVIVVACVMQTANKVWALARERKE